MIMIQLVTTPRSRRKLIGDNDDYDYEDNDKVDDDDDDNYDE